MGNRASQLLPQAERKVAKHLSAAKESEAAAQRIRDEFAMGEKMERGRFPSLGRVDQDIVGNMNELSKMQGIITGASDKQVMPEGALNPGAKRKLAGRGQVRQRDKDEPVYGVTQIELSQLHALRRAQPDVHTVPALAARFKIKPEDVKLLLRYTAPVVSYPDASDAAQLLSRRDFDPRPDV